MAIIKSLHVVVVAVTLCFLLVLAAQGREHNVTVTVQGQARCKNNPSAVLSHTPLHLMINGKTVPGAGTTTSTGQVVMSVNLTTAQQVQSMLSSSSQVLVTAPPHTCGAPSIPKGTVVAARLNITALILGNDDDDTPAASRLITIIDGNKLPARLNKMLLKISDVEGEQPTIAASDIDVPCQLITRIIATISCVVCVAITHG